MNVYCYYHDPADTRHNYPAGLIREWSDSWRQHGFEPTILTEAQARKHPGFTETDILVSSFPTVNDWQYERACWLRWLAYEQVAPAVFTDYDVINFGLTTDKVPVGDLVSFALCRNPGSVYATVKGIREFIAEFVNAHKSALNKSAGTHCSDLTLFSFWHKGPAYDLCVDSNSPKASTAPLVHFCNVSVKPEHRFAHRHLAVAEFRKQRQ